MVIHPSLVQWTRFKESRRQVSVAEAARVLRTDECEFEGYTAVLLYMETYYIGVLGMDGYSLVINSGGDHGWDLEKLERRLFDYAMEEGNGTL